MEKQDSFKAKIGRILNTLFLTIGIGIIAGSTIYFLIEIKFYNEVGDITKNIKYTKIIEEYSKDDYVIMIANLCNLHDNDLDKIDCVYNFYNDFYRYGNKSNLVPVYDMLTNSTDCKNSVAFYCSVFKNMNISCKPTFIPGHTFATVYIDYGYCNIDQDFIDCKRLV